MGGLPVASNEVVARTIVWTVAAVVAVVLACTFVPAFLNTDTAQYVVTARHLLRGDGLATSLIYFEQQIASGSIPAPQTVWPPGYPWLIAAVMFFGVPFTYAPFLVALGSHVLSAIVLFSLLRRLGCGPWLAAGGAVANASTVLFAVMVLRGLSEPTYTLCTLASAWCVAVAMESSRARQWLVAGGAAAAGAFLTRYAGIAFVAAFGLMVATMWLASRSRKAWWDAFFAMLIPAVVVAVLFLRNHFLVGSFSGGPSVGFGSSMSQVARGTFWAFEQVFGAVDTFGNLALLLMAAGMLVVFLAAIRRREESSHVSKPAFWVLVLSFAYLVCTVGMYGYMALSRTPEVLAARYFLPLLPFVILVACVFVAAARRNVARVNVYRRGMAALILTVFVVFVAMQARSVSQWQEWFRGDTKFATIIRAMDEPFEGKSLREIIESLSGPDGAVLAVDGQLLGMWLDRPVVGLSDAAWTRRTWTADEVHALVKRYNVKLICEFPPNFDVAARENRHRIFFIELAEGRVPDWLRLAASTDSARLYEVVR